MDSETAEVLSAHCGGMGRWVPMGAEVLSTHCGGVGHRAPMGAGPSPHEADSFQTVRDVYCSISVYGVFVKVA